jgi:hypothetical protein
LLAEAAEERTSEPRRVCQFCVDMLGVSGAGISVLTSAGLSSLICATDEASALIDELQRTVGEGPALDAVTAGMPVLAADLGEPGDLSVDRWPAFMDGAYLAGVRAVFAFPLRVGAINVGALTLYRVAPGSLRPAELAGALLATDAAALSLLRLDDSPASYAEQLDRRWFFEPQVHQATGMVQVQLGITTDQAFLVLRARAFADARPLAEIAADVVDRKIRFAQEDR